MTATAVLEPMSTYGRDDRLALAQVRDGRVRELDRQAVATWSEMAELAVLVREQRDFELLGYHSWHSWLLSAAPHSRSAVYLAIQHLESLKDIATEDLRQIPLGSAKVLAAVPKSKRSKKLIAAAKSPPRTFKKHVREKFPDLHIEASTTEHYKFEESQKKVVDAAIDMANMLEAGEVLSEPIMSRETAIEKICAHYMLTNRELWEKIKAGDGESDGEA